MTKQEIEFQVLAAWDRKAGGRNAEDSHIEFKREMPQRSWTKHQWWKLARIVAALANSAGGREIILVWETSHTDVDEADLWPQLWKHFDDNTHPDLVASFEVQVSDSKRVLAAAFNTDRAPFVLQAWAGGRGQENPIDFWELPIREGTRTRSGRRRDFYRLVLPRARLPHVSTIFRLSVRSPHRAPDVLTLEAEMLLEIFPTSLVPCCLKLSQKATLTWGESSCDVRLLLRDGQAQAGESKMIPPAQKVVFTGSTKSSEWPSPVVSVRLELEFAPGDLISAQSIELKSESNRSKWIGRSQ